MCEYYIISISTWLPVLIVSHNSKDIPAQLDISSFIRTLHLETAMHPDSLAGAKILAPAGAVLGTVE